MIETKFKLGDTVKIIKRKHGNETGQTPECYEENGFVGVLGIVRGTMGNYTIYSLDNLYCGLFDEDDLELIFQYEHLPFPKDSYLKLKFKDDFDPLTCTHHRGNLNKFVPKDTITWVSKRHISRNMYLIECNRWNANFPSSIFEVIEDVETIPKKPLFNFIIGKWYSFNWDWESTTNGKTIVKVSEVNSGSIITKYRIYAYRSPFDCNFTYEDDYNFKDMSDIKELSIEEVQQYLPDDHPDKIKSLVGRYIKALVDRPNGGAVLKDEIGLIIEENDRNVQVNFPSQKEYGCTKLYFSERYELMPEGYIHDSQSKFPEEGCVYDTLDNLTPLSKYLISRPFNAPDTKISKSEAIGVGWNSKSCWWLKTKTSSKTQYSIQQINKLFDYERFKSTLVPTTSESKFITLNDSHIGKFVSLKNGGNFYDKVLVSKENGNIYLKNNCHSNNNSHSDKSIFKYSLLYTNFSILNNCCSEITLLDNQDDVTTLNPTQTSLEKKDLIEGEIYVYDKVHVCIYPTGPYLSIHGEYYNSTNNWLWTLDIQPATLEQKEWLKACIKANKFIPKEEINVKKDGRERPLKTFEVGKWYINPQMSNIHSSFKYFKIGEVKQNFSDYWYNSFIFDEAADENWNITKTNITQANTDFDQDMVLVEKLSVKPEEWVPKVGDWIFALHSAGSHKKGDITQVTFYGQHNGNLKLMTPELDKKFPDKNGWAYLKCFRKAEPHEIHIIVKDPTENVTMNTSKNYTAEEALAELKKRGFKEGCEYIYMDEVGEYDRCDIRTAERDPSIRGGGNYIDCGLGYLWSSDNPSHLHEGPINKSTQVKPSKEWIPEEGDFIVYNEKDVVKVTNVREDKYHGYWITHTYAEFDGGGFAWNPYKHKIRKANSDEILVFNNKLAKESPSFITGIYISDHRHSGESSEQPKDYLNPKSLLQKVKTLPINN